MTYVIGEPCVDIRDKACVDECPVDCIYEGDRMLYIHPDECVDCAACEPVCPVEAIVYIDDASDEWQPYVSANADLFADIGSPGGARGLGRQPFDAPFVARLAQRNSSADDSIQSERQDSGGSSSSSPGISHS